MTVALTFVLMLSAPAQEADPSKRFVDAYSALGMPGTQHETLVALAGDWQVAGRMRFSPEDEWEAFFASAEITPMLGGRFISERIAGDQTESWPVPYKGLRILGYDNAANEFNAVVLNNLQTSILSMSGALDGSLLTLRGTFDSPLTGEQQEWRTDYEYRSSDRFVLREFPRTAENVEYLGIEAVYTRARADNPLVGTWTGTYVEGHGMTFVFDGSGSAQWRVVRPEGTISFSLSYRIDLSTTPHAIELHGFQDGPLAGRTMYGIFELEGTDSFRLDLEPGEAGSTGDGVRPTEFSDRTLTCRKQSD